MKEPLLTPRDLADRLNISRNIVYKLLQKGEIPSRKIGASIRTTEEELDAYLKRGKEE